MRTPSILLLVLAAACSSGTQGGSTTTPAPTSSTASAGRCPLESGSTVLATEFTSSGERAALMLEAGCVYWAETDVGGITIQLRPRSSGTQMPYIGRQMSGGVQGGSTWEVRTTTTGEYQIWATGAQSGRSVRVTVTVRGDNAPKGK